MLLLVTSAKSSALSVLGVGSVLSLAKVSWHSFFTSISAFAIAVCDTRRIGTVGSVSAVVAIVLLSAIVFGIVFWVYSVVVVLRPMPIIILAAISTANITNTHAAIR